MVGRLVPQRSLEGVMDWINAPKHNDSYGSTAFVVFREDVG